MGEESISVFLVFFATLLSVVLILSKFLHDSPRINSVLPEAAMVLAVGMIAGFFIHMFVAQKQTGQSSQNNGDDDELDAEVVDSDLSALLSFSPEIFFIALLPPIIFNSGLRIGALFFRHIVPICMMAVIGTTVSAVSIAFMLQLVIGLGFGGDDFQPRFSELLTFGALISSTDPVSTLAVFQAKRVNPQLFYLVFGESVLNDALGIVLFEAFAKFASQEANAGTIALGFAEFAWDLFIDSVGSLGLGVASGLAVAMLFKHIDMRQTKVLEISTYLMLMYIPFLLAQIMHLSGIVTVLFTGITANRYVLPNLSPVTRVNADMMFRLLAHIAETSIFLELGLSVFGLIGHWNWKFIGWSLLACLVGRALNVYPISFCFNKLLLNGSDQSVPAMETELAAADRSMDGGNGGMKEKLQPASQYDLDEGVVLDTAMSEATATPLKRKDLKIRSNTQHMLWFSGLRGAVAYACVRGFPDGFGHQKDFTMTTMAIVVITVFVLGSTTETALNVFRITTNVDEKEFMKEHLREPVVATAVSTFDEKVIKPIVIRDFNTMTGVGHNVGGEADGNETGCYSSHHNGTVEMTEKHHLDSLEPEAEARLRTLMRQDALFDYGGN